MTPTTSTGSRDRLLSDRVYEDILGMIASGQIPKGAKLPTEHALCDLLKVSRPVLRKSLRQLREDGLIVSRQGSGSYVQRQPLKAVLEISNTGSVADIQRIFEFRTAIEGEAACLAAQRRSSDELLEITKCLNGLERCIEIGDLGAEEDEAFHAAICKSSGNPFFELARSSLKSDILNGIHLTRNLSLAKPPRRLEIVQQEHREIAKAIEDQDAKRARKAMRTHIENARKRVFNG